MAGVAVKLDAAPADVDVDADVDASVGGEVAGSDRGERGDESDEIVREMIEFQLDKSDGTFGFSVSASSFLPACLSACLCVCVCVCVCVKSPGRVLTHSLTHSLTHKLTPLMHFPPLLLLTPLRSRVVCEALASLCDVFSGAAPRWACCARAMRLSG